MGEPWPLGWSIGAFVASAAAIAFLGVRLAALADTLADRLRIGEALFGGLFLGASTSLAGIVASVSAAARGMPELAWGNAVGGIAVQTAFLAVADIAFRRVNLEHAAASFENLMSGALLMALLSIAMVAAFKPPIAVWGISPATPLMIGVYLYGLTLVRQGHRRPMWTPKATRETVADVPHDEEGKGPSTGRLWLGFGACTAGAAVAGWVVAQSGGSLSHHTGLSQTVVGALFMAVATSLPELITSVAAVRQGSPTLAVGGIIGGNAFDTLFLAFSDIAYRQGSLFHAAGDQGLYLINLGMLQTAVLLLGLLRRERRGPGNIGFESVALLVVYLGGMALLFVGG